MGYPAGLFEAKPEKKCCSRIPRWVYIGGCWGQNGNSKVRASDMTALKRSRRMKVPIDILVFAAVSVALTIGYLTVLAVNEQMLRPPNNDEFDVRVHKGYPSSPKEQPEDNGRTSNAPGNEQTFQPPMPSLFSPQGEHPEQTFQSPISHALPSSHKERPAGHGRTSNEPSISPFQESEAQASSFQVPAVEPFFQVPPSQVPAVLAVQTYVYQGPALPAFQGPAYQGPAYQGPVLPAFQGPNFTVPAFQGPAFTVPVFQGPTFPVPAFQGPTFK